MVERNSIKSFLTDAARAVYLVGFEWAKDWKKYGKNISKEKVDRARGFLLQALDNKSVKTSLCPIT
jgi:hypothetical protein